MRILVEECWNVGVYVRIQEKVKSGENNFDVGITQAVLGFGACDGAAVKGKAIAGNVHITLWLTSPLVFWHMQDLNT